MAYGVTPQGFEKMRLPEIREDIVEQLKANLRAKGLSDDIKTSPRSVVGVLIDTFAERESAMWDMAEGVYYSMYPGSATGSSLDRSVSFSGVVRLLPERSQVFEVVYGIQNTDIPAGSQIRNKVTQTLWETATDVTISALAAVDVTIIPEVEASTDYTVTIDAVNYTYHSGASPTVALILAGLVAELSSSGLQVTSDGASVRLLSTTGTSTSFILSTDNLTFDQIGSSVLVQTMEPLAEAVAVDDLNSIVTLIDGWESVTNLTVGSVGRVSETDAQLATRYETGVFRLGAGTLPSIAPNIINDVPGVTAIRVFENDTDAVDSEVRLPHSIHVVIEGGIDQLIAAAIYKYKGGGIDTNGDVVTELSTLEGIQEIHHDRPTAIYVWVKAEITILPAEEQAFPADGFSRVQKAINTTGQTLGIGNDVISQKFYCGIYETPGISTVDLTFAHSTDPEFVPDPGDYSASNIEIGDTERARFDLSRVEVL